MPDNKWVLLRFCFVRLSLCGIICPSRYVFFTVSVCWNNSVNNFCYQLFLCCLRKNYEQRTLFPVLPITVYVFISAALNCTVDIHLQSKSCICLSLIRKHILLHGPMLNSNLTVEQNDHRILWFKSRSPLNNAYWNWVYILKNGNAFYFWRGKEKTQKNMREI